MAEAGAPFLAGIFVRYNTNLLDMTVHAFRSYSISFLFMGFSIYASSFFTALNDGFVSAVISFCRTMIFETGLSSSCRFSSVFPDLVLHHRGGIYGGMPVALLPDPEGEEVRIRVN